MADLIDDLKESVEQLISSVDKGGQVRSTIEALRKQIAEADRKRQVRRVQAELAERRGKVEQATVDLGVQTLAFYEAGKLNHAELAALCRQIVEMKAEIAKLEQELAKLQPVAAPEAGTPCPSCGQPLPQEGSFCPYCGARRSESAAAAPRYCAHCGAALRPKAKFCPACGRGVASL